MYWVAPQSEILTPKPYFCFDVRSFKIGQVSSRPMSMGGRPLGRCTCVSLKVKRPKVWAVALNACKMKRYFQRWSFNISHAHVGCTMTRPSHLRLVTVSRNCQKCRMVPYVFWVIWCLFTSFLFNFVKLPWQWVANFLFVGIKCNQLF